MITPEHRRALAHIGALTYARVIADAQERAHQAARREILEAMAAGLELELARERKYPALRRAIRAAIAAGADPG